MKLVIVKGNYQFEKEKNYSGLIILFHINSKDTKKEYKLASMKIVDMANGRDIVLVPFSHLSNDVMEFEKAKKFSFDFYSLCKKNYNENVYLIPFGIDKEFFLSSTGVADFKYKEF